MTWDSVWAIEGGQTSADVGRLLSWHAVNGQTGVAAPTDLRVVARDVPTGGVRVMPGTCSIPVKALGKTRQVYIASNPDADDSVAVPSTGSSGGRSDLIVARVENPIAGEPWQVPEDPLNAIYIRTHRYHGVPANTVHVNQVDPSASAITLARIDIPANTGAITQAMIRDLRGESLQQRGEPPLPTTPYAAANQDFYDAIDFDRNTVVEDKLPYTQQTYKVWPNAGVWDITVPSAATEAIVNISVHCEQRQVASNLPGHCWGYARLRMVGYGDFSTDVEFDRDYYGGGTPTTVLIPIGGRMPIPKEARGKKIRFQCEAKQFADNMTKGQLVIAKGSFITCHIHFNVLPSSS